MGQLRRLRGSGTYTARPPADGDMEFVVQGSYEFLVEGNGGRQLRTMRVRTVHHGQALCDQMHWQAGDWYRPAGGRTQAEAESFLSSIS